MFFIQEGNVRPNENMKLESLISQCNFIYSRNYAAMIGIVSHDFFDELSNKELVEGIAGEQRDQMLQVTLISLKDNICKN